MIRFQVGLIKKFTNKFTNILPKKEVKKATPVKTKTKTKKSPKKIIKGKFTFTAPYVTVAEQLAS